MVAAAAALFGLGLLPFPEMLFFVFVAVAGTFSLVAGLSAFDDRVTGRMARFALAIALLGLAFAVLGGAAAAIAAASGPTHDTVAAAVLDMLIWTLAMGGAPLLMAGGAVAAYFTRTRAAGIRRLRWVAFESALVATVAYVLGLWLLARLAGSL